ncbi:phospholipase A2 inhibitor beta-like isoform X2 [Planococcus citri]|uniref:phospholipase A2 inhibitor beta-like isoform X2 n=1 Tax=Planococcus citri TaxID=170843 RepID=UPI0031F98897
MSAEFGIKTLKFLIFLSSLHLLQFVSSTQAQESCPNNCVCSSLQNSLSEAKCDQFPLLEQLDDYLQILKIESAEICPISKDLQRFTRLTSLSVSNCAVDVNVNSFQNLAQLQNVTFYNTSIVNLDPSLFEYNRNLKVLNLSSNPLKIWRNVLVSNSIEDIDLSYCDLKVIPKNAFSQILNLKRLILKGNELKSMNNVLPLSTTFLDLSDNDLEAVSIKALRPLADLEQIDISGNPLICSCKLKLIEKYLSLKNVSFVKPVECIDKGNEHVSLESISLRQVCNLGDNLDENSTLVKLFKRLRRSANEEFDSVEQSPSETYENEEIRSMDETPEGSAEILNTLESRMQNGEEGDEEMMRLEITQTPRSSTASTTPANEEPAITLKGIISLLGCTILVVIVLVIGVIAAILIKLITDSQSSDDSMSAAVCAAKAMEEMGADDGSGIPMMSRRSSRRGCCHHR